MTHSTEEGARSSGSLETWFKNLKPEDKEMLRVVTDELRKESISVYNRLSAVANMKNWFIDNNSTISELSANYCTAATFAIKNPAYYVVIPSKLQKPLSELVSMVLNQLNSKLIFTEDLQRIFSKALVSSDSLSLEELKKMTLGLEEVIKSARDICLEEAPQKTDYCNILESIGASVNEITVDPCHNNFYNQTTSELLVKQEEPMIDPDL